MAVANSLAGLAGGGGRSSATVNGIGERAGNAAAGRSRDGFNVRTTSSYWNRIDTTCLTRASKLVSAATSFPGAYNKAIRRPGTRSPMKAHSSDGVLKMPTT